ncbi:MAG: prefoldin subunit beta [Promethearchaeota archaeon]
MSVGELPPQMQQEILRLQQMQQQYELIAAQRNQSELQLRETERALTELENIDADTTVYKSVGTLLIKVDRDPTKKELSDQKETLEIRVKTLKRQEEQLRKQIQDATTKLQAKLERRGAGAS